MATVDMKLRRVVLAGTLTLGLLSFAGTDYFTIEDRVRELSACTATTCVGKVPQETAIPAGRYRVTYEWSPKFKRNMLRLHDVPGFQGILIHGAGTLGNNFTGTEKSSWGCIILGLSGNERSVSDTKAAVARLNEQVITELQKGNKVYITITNESSRS